MGLHLPTQNFFLLIDTVDHANVDDGLHALKIGLAANKSLLKNKPIQL